MQRSTLRKSHLLLQDSQHRFVYRRLQEAGCSAPPAPPPAPGSAADGDAQRFAGVDQSGPDSDALVVVDQRHRSGHRAGSRESGPARFNPRESERVDHLHDHGDGRRRHGHGQRARGCERAERAGATTAPSGTGECQELFEQNVKDAFFDLDKSDLRPDAREALTKDAEFLRSYPQVRLSHRRPLRRARIDRIQPGPWPAARGSGEELSDFARHHRRPDRNDQLGQRAPVLHGT